MAVGDKFVKPLGPIIHKLFVIEVFIDDYLNNGKSQGAVRAGADGNPFGAGAFGGFRMTGVDNHNVTTAFGRGFQAIHVQRGGIRGRIGSPNDQHFRVFHIGIHIDQHTAQGDVGGDHGKRDIT